MENNLAYLLLELEKYSQKYEFSFQFWGAGHNNFFINVNSVEIFTPGGFNTINDAIVAALEFIYKMKRVPRENRITNSFSNGK